MKDKDNTHHVAFNDYSSKRVKKIDILEIQMFAIRSFDNETNNNIHIVWKYVCSESLKLIILHLVTITKVICRVTIK